MARTVFLFAVLTILEIAAAFAGAVSHEEQTQPPQVSFESSAVDVRGNPGARFVVLSIVRTDRQLVREVVRRDQIVVDDDRDGLVRIALPRSVPEDSLWAVVDLESGARAVATPDGSSFRSIESTPYRWKGEVDEQLNRLEIHREWVEILWVRPGMGCWRLRNGDGGSFDKDGKADGRISLDADQMTSIGDSPAAPKHFKKGDIIIVIDPRGLRYFAVEVPR